MVMTSRPWVQAPMSFDYEVGAFCFSSSSFPRRVVPRAACTANARRSSFHSPPEPKNGIQCSFFLPLHAPLMHVCTSLAPDPKSVPGPRRSHSATATGQLDSVASLWWGLPLVEDLPPFVLLNSPLRACPGVLMC